MCSKPTELETKAGITRWVARFRTDAIAVSDIRAAAFRLTVQFPHLAKLRNADPLVTLTQLLEFGEFHVCACGAQAASGAGGGGGTKALTPPPPSRQPIAAPRSVPTTDTAARARDDYDAQSVLSAVADPAAIAEVQRRAARMGVPFCEECAKAHRANAAGV